MPRLAALAALTALALAGRASAQPVPDPEPPPRAPRAVVSPQPGPPLVSAPFAFALPAQAPAVPAGGGTVIIIVTPGQTGALGSPVVGAAPVLGLAGSSPAAAGGDTLRDVIDLLRAIENRQRGFEQRLRELESRLPPLPRPADVPVPERKKQS